MAHSDILAELGTKSLLSVVPGLDDLILEKGKLRLVAGETEIAKLGSRTDFLIIPISGNLKLTLDDSEGNHKFVGQLQARQSLGLGELIEGTNYSYSARTEGPMRVLYV